MQNLGFNQCPRSFLSRKIRAWQEYLTHTDWVVRRIVACASDMLTEEILWHFHANTRAISGLAIRIDSASVPDILQCLDPHLHDFATRLAIERCDKANTTSIMLIFGVIGVAVHQLLTVGLILFYII